MVFSVHSGGAAEDDRQAGERAFMDELSAARDEGRRTPDFFIVGHAKCGTTALYEMIEGHPQVYMSVPKETQFLSRAPHERALVAAGPRPGRPVRRPETLDAYLSLFAGADAAERAGEASTEYLRTPGTAARIAQLSPDARIVAIFREPASFLRSLHLQLLEVGVESERDFARAIELEAARSEGREIPPGCRWPAALQYSRHVRYSEQLREYHEHFPRERVLALIYDDFRADNERVVREVLRFLGADDSLRIGTSEANPTVRVRSKRAHDLLTATAVGRGPVLGAVRKAVKALTPATARRGALRTINRTVVDTKPRAPDERLMDGLRRRFKGEVVAASEYLGRDLVSLWGYDEVR